MARPIHKAPQWRTRFQAVVGRSIEEAAPELDAAVEETDTAKGYLHWDQLRHRETPAGWDREDFWALVRFRRMTRAKLLPRLRQKSGEPFMLSVTSPMVAALHRTDTREALWKSVLEPNGRELTEGTYQLMAAIEEAHHSSAIEGAVTTRRESKDLIRTKRAPRNRSEQMVLNNYGAIQRMDEWQESPLTRDLILEVQSTVTQDTLDDPADQGRFREDDEVRIRDGSTGEVVYQPPKASELEERMGDLCLFANEEPCDENFLNPVTRAILIHHQLAYDHPFGDGNGRTARTLFMWSMLRSGYHWLKALSISRAVYQTRSQYYRSFQYVQLDEGDVTYFVRHQLKCLEREIDHLARFLENRARTERKLRERKVLEGGLNARQLALIAYALRHPETVFTVREHLEFHGVTQPTAWKDLENLAEKGLLAKSRAGRKALYSASPRLAKLSKGQD